MINCSTEYLAIVVLSLITLSVIRICFLLPFTNVCLENTYKDVDKEKHVMILLGSGGHTGEMMRLLDHLDFKKFSKITFVVTSEDTVSISKAHNFLIKSKLVGSLNSIKYYNFTDEMLQRITKDFRANSQDGLFDSKTCVSYVMLPKARNVNQSKCSSIFTTLHCIFKTIYLVFIKLHSIPDLVFCNGPGTSVPLCYSLFVSKLITLGALNPKLTYIESLARVKSLSLSGWLLYPIVDRFIVQWPDLHFKYKRTRYYGILV